MSEQLPERGELWWVGLDPTVGVEVRKTRPAVVLTARRFQALPIRIVIPLVTWQERFNSHANKVFVPATPGNGLSNDSAADVTEVRSAAMERFGTRIGVLDAGLVSEIAGRLAMAVGFDTRTLGR